MKWLLLVLLPACIAFNETCTPPLSEPVGELRQSLDIRDHTLRTAEAIAGNLVADALLEQTTGADVAVIPANAFSRTRTCAERDFIEQGTVTVADIQAMLPSDQTVVLITITAEDLKRTLEHSVAEVGEAPGEHAGFLQVANLLFTVDCAERAHSLANGDISFPGARVSSIFVKNMPTTPGQMLKLATVANIASLGYVDLGRPGRLLVDTHKTAAELVAAYLREHTPAEAAIQGRIQLRDTCR